MNADERRWIQRPQRRRRACALSYLRASVCICGFVLPGLLSGCKRDEMADQPRYNPLEPSGFFADGKSARPLVPGTVARNRELPSPARYEAEASGQEMTAFPIEIGLKDLKRGQERYNIFCSPCHGFSGDGDGMIVQRGFTRPPSFHLDRLRAAPPGHFFNVMTNGYGGMYSYAERVPVDDRWKIAAYIRALQMSRGADEKDLSPQDRTSIQAAIASASAASTSASAQPAPAPATPSTTQPQHPESNPR